MCQKESKPFIKGINRSVQILKLILQPSGRGTRRGLVLGTRAVPVPKPSIGRSIRRGIWHGLVFEMVPVPIP